MEKMFGRNQQTPLISQGKTEKIAKNPRKMGNGKFLKLQKTGKAHKGVEVANKKAAENQKRHFSCGKLERDPYYTPFVTVTVCNHLITSALNLISTVVFN